MDYYATLNDASLLTPPRSTPWALPFRQLSLCNEFGTWKIILYLNSDTVQRLRRHRISTRCEDENAKAVTVASMSFVGDLRSTGRHESSHDPSLVALRLPANRCRSSFDTSSLQRGEADTSGGVGVLAEVRGVRGRAWGVLYEVGQFNCFLVLVNH